MLQEPTREDNDALLRAVAAPLDVPAVGTPRRRIFCLRCHQVVLVACLALGAFGGYCCWSAIYHAPILKPGPPSPPASADLYRGVNAGGWLVLEPWVTPSLFYPFLCVGDCPDDTPPVVDEHSFCERLGAPEAQRRLDDFRSSWVTEDTFARFAASGLNTVRVPFGYWVFGDQDVCNGVVSIHHLDNAVAWADQHGLQLILDLHGVAHSQNGMDHSGTSTHAPYREAWKRPLLDGREWLQPASLNITRGVLRRVAARYAASRSVVRIGMVNEPMAMARDWCGSNCPLHLQEVAEYFDGTWKELEQIVPARVQPVLDVGLGGTPSGWAGVAIAERLRGGVMDTHVYQAWTPFGIELIPQVMHLRMAACDGQAQLRAYARDVLPVMVGEWSTAVTDCATWLNGLGQASGADATGVHAKCSRVPCPTRFNNLTRGASETGGPDADGNCPTGYAVDSGAPRGPLEAHVFYKRMTEYMLYAYETSAGWTFWNFDNEIGDPRWSFFRAQELGWFPANLSHAAYAPPTAKCDEPDSYLGAFTVAAIVTAGAGVLAGYAACVLVCMTKRCTRLRLSAGRSCASMCPPGCGRLCCCCCAVPSSTTSRVSF